MSSMDLSATDLDTVETETIIANRNRELNFSPSSYCSLQLWVVSMEMHESIAD